MGVGSSRAFALVAILAAGEVEVGGFALFVAGAYYDGTVEVFVFAVRWAVVSVVTVGHLRELFVAHTFVTFPSSQSGV